MVKFVDVRHMQNFVRHHGVENVLRDLAVAIEADFGRWAEFDKCARVAAHADNGVVELMPTSDGTHYGFKYVNGHPGNTKAGLQTVAAFGVLSSMQTGYPLLLSEMTIATALRTAATSAMAAKHLARKDARTMAIIGLGAQSEFQALAFRAVLGVNSLRVHDLDAAAARKFSRNLGPLGFDITVCANVESAVLGADIITTITADKTNATILTDNMVGAGVHLNAVGGDCPGKTELQAGILNRAEVFVEYPPQTRIEGEIQQMPDDFAVTELADVIAGKAAGRSSDNAVTLFDSVGFAIEDFSTLRFIHDGIEGTGFYDEIDLVVEPHDPRDLYSLVAPVALKVAAE